MDKEEMEKNKRKVLLIAGDFWHAPAGAYLMMDAICQKQAYSLTAVYGNHDVPWANLDSYRCIVLYRAGGFASDNDGGRWLTVKQEQLLADFVYRGGSFLALHCGVCFYDQDSPMREMMRGHFVKHPPEMTYRVIPESNDPLCAGFAPFTIHDEMFLTDVEVNRTAVFLHSKAEGFDPVISGWHHGYGTGKFIGLTPGHTVRVMREPAMQEVVSACMTDLMERV